MVDEYDGSVQDEVEWVNGSDSSMVDEYFGESRSVLRATIVQIPLWSMNTKSRRHSAIFFSSSDSSMVDEYPGELKSRGG